jgi:hypothetical protein
MNKLKNVMLLLLLSVGMLGPAFGQQTGMKLSVPLGGNSWITRHSELGSEKVTQNGWADWT